MQLGVIDFSEKHANIGTLFWATVYVTQKKPLSKRHKKLRNAAHSTCKTRVCEEWGK